MAVSPNIIKNTVVGHLPALLAVMRPPPDVKVSELAFYLDVICHFCFTYHPFMYLWFAEMLTANIYSWRLGYLLLPNISIGPKMI